MRSFVLSILFFLALIPRGQGQSCFVVNGAADQAPVAGCAVSCAGGSPLAVSGADGRVCLEEACDQLHLSARGFQPRKIPFIDAVSGGTVVLEPENALPAVQVEPWPRPSDRRALASTSEPDSAALYGYDRSGSRNATLNVPGVQWDERGHGGSQRLSIRGSLLRSPYGTRGVKVYWGPFPLTLADGSTPLEVLDPELMGTLAVVRSAGGPVFGSAPAGVLLSDVPWAASPGIGAEASFIGGSYGYFKLAASASTRTPTSALSAGVLRLGNDGFRLQESARRDQAWLANKWYHEHGVLLTYITAQRASWGLPGSLDSLTAATDPQQPRAWSRSIDAHIEKTQLFAGIRSELLLGKNLRLSSGIHGQLIDKRNPYGTTPPNSGDKQENIRNAGARISLSQQTGRLFWEAGIEALSEQDGLQERSWGGTAFDVAAIDATTNVRSLNAFANSLTRLGRGTTLHLALGVERTLYRHDDALHGAAFEQHLRTEPYPLAGVEHRFTPGLLGRVRYAEAVSRPTVWELLGTEGVVNTGLRPERVREWEAAMALGSDTSTMRLQATGYYRLTDALISAVEEEAGTRFVNAGTSVQPGLEMTLDVRQGINGKHRIEATLSLAVQQGEWTPADATARAVPGVPDRMGAAVVRFVHRRYSTLEIGVRATSSTAASSSNNVRVPGSSVVHARLSHRLRWTSGSVSVFVHLENIFDERYTAFVQIDDPGRRYYNPAPGRSVQAGATFSFGKER